MRTKLVIAAVAVSLLAACATQPGTASSAGATQWVASWGTSQMIPEPQNALAPELWRNASLRQVVHVSLGGTRLRVRFSNAFGSQPLTIDSASIARSLGAGKADVDAASQRRLSFAGRSTVMVPAGGEYYSDPVDLEHAAGADLAVTLHFKAEPARQTGHGGSRTTSFVASGDKLMEASWQEPTKVVRWYQLADIEVQAARDTGVVVAIGDSITDGYGATTDGNDRWPDQLARRLRRDGGTPMGVVNAGIGGGRMLRDGLGPNLISRFDRDVMGRSGVTHAIVHIGVNDLGIQHRNGDDTPSARKQLVEDLQTAYGQLAQRARNRGVCLIGATVTPYQGSDYYKPGADNEADRQAINAWIRGAAIFDGVADFDAALRDPAHPERLKPEYDTGDHLHPSLAGYRVMADAVPMAALRHNCRQ